MILAVPSTHVGGGSLPMVAWHLAIKNVGAGLPAMMACQPTPINLTPRDQKCGSWLACDNGLPADTYLPDTPQSNCGGGLAREGGLTGDAVIPGTYPFLR